MVNIINRSMYPVQTSLNLISQMQDRFATLQVQLATGQKATNLAEMGSSRYFDLSIRARMTRIEGYQNNISMANMRLSVFDQVLGRLDKVESTARAAITPSAYGSSSINFGTAPALARSNLDEVINLLNTDVDGRYLFAGGKVDQRPVESISAILDGAGGKVGFRVVAAERLEADQGDGYGRLARDVTGATVTLSQELNNDHFGLKLSTSTATGSGLDPTSLAGPPPALAIEVAAQPVEGDSVTIGLTMPDGTEEAIVLRAVTGTPGKGEFQIGADEAATAANLKASLDTALADMTKTELVAASNFAAADNFFNAQGDEVMRVQGTPATATSLVAADATNTVMWYKGEDATNARASVKVKVDDATSINYGAQANESGPLALVRSLAVLAIQNFNTLDTTSEGRFDAVATRNYSRLSESHNNESGSIEMMAAEMGNALANIDSISSRQTNYNSQLEGLLGDLESVSKEDVAMEMLALQTRLQASYQATSLIASLSLVNYIK